MNNEKIINEIMIVFNSILKERSNDDKTYSRYHLMCADCYSMISTDFSRIFNINDPSIDKLIDHIRKTTLTKEQKQAIIEVRKHPMFKKIMGETSLKEKDELESLLGTKINNQGMIFAGPNNEPAHAYKTEEQLEEEINEFYNKLSQLLSERKITNEQYEKHVQDLDYIYAYYISQSNGEQIPFRQITDAQYSFIEQRAKQNGISFDEQFYQETNILLENHEELQELQSEGMNR